MKKYYGHNSLKLNSKLNTKKSALMKNIMTIDDDNCDFFGWDEKIGDFNWDDFNWKEFISTYVDTNTPSSPGHNKKITQTTTNNQKNDDVNEISFLRKV